MKTVARRKQTAKDPAWDAADWRYSGLVAKMSVPFFGRKVPVEDEMQCLEEIVRDYPAYYPALYHLGSRKVASGKEAEGRGLLLEAAQRMAQRERAGEFEPEEMDQVLEFLQANLRYDVARELLERLIQLYPSQAYFYDELGAADARIIEEIYAGLLSFYGFLAQGGLLDRQDYKEFRSDLLRRKLGLLRKTRRYGAVRHDGSISEEEKERVREELFKGAHSWPGI